MSLKNLLSENMLRFGTKNLSERQERELVVKSIMETINQHGLHGEVRRRLMEQTAPSKGKAAIIDFNGSTENQFKQGPDPESTVGGTKALVYQNDDSLTKAEGIMRKLFDGAVKGNTEAVKQALYSIRTDTYPAALWIIRHAGWVKSHPGNPSKKNFSDIADYLGQFFSKEMGDPAGFFKDIHELFADTQVSKTVSRHLKQFNRSEDMLDSSLYTGGLSR